MPIRRVSKKQLERNKIKKEETEKMFQLFREIWDEREDEMGYCYCFETGIAMHGTYYRSNSACYDHVLEKSDMSYPQYKMVKDNIIIVHPDVHAQRHVNIDKCPNIKKYREKLLALHSNGELSNGEENSGNIEKEVLE